MEVMCKALMDWEPIARDQVLEIMAGKHPSPPKDYSHNIRPENGSAEPEFTQLPEAEVPVTEQPAPADSPNQHGNV